MPNPLESADKSKAVELLTGKTIGLIITIVMLVLILLTFLQVTGLYVGIKSKRTGNNANAVAEHLNNANASAGIIANQGNNYNASKAANSLIYSQEHSDTSMGQGANATWTTNQLDQPWCDQRCQMEKLVNNRGEPDFWEISGELASYRRGVAGRKFKGGNYWSPDLQAWLSADEVASLTADERANVQFYGDLGAVRDVQGLGSAREHLTNLNVAYQTPESSMLMENMSSMVDSTLIDQGELY